MTTTAPLARQIPCEYDIQGHHFSDPYSWLRDKSWPHVTNPAILGYLTEENDYCDKTLFSLYPELKEQLFSELKGRIKCTDISTETKSSSGNYYYYTRMEEEKNYPIYCRKKILAQESLLLDVEEVVLDVNELAKDHQFTRVSSIFMSNNDNMIAYSVDYIGNERYDIKILDLNSKKYIEHNMPQSIGSIVWDADNSGIFYTRVEDEWRANKVYYHKLYSNNHDVLVFEETDHTYQVTISKSANKQYLFINVGGNLNNEIYFTCLDKPSINSLVKSPKDTLHLIKAREGRIQYSVDYWNDYILILINDHGDNFRIAKCNPNNLNYDNWQDLVPIHSVQILTSMDVTEDFLIVNYKERDLMMIKIINTANVSRTIVFPDEIYAAYAYSTNFLDNDIRVNYSSLKRPQTIYSYSYESQTLNILKTQEIPSGFDANEYEATRVWATSNDGTLIPISVLYKKSTFCADSSNPLFLTGYGAYGYSYEPTFNPNILSLVNRGFIFAIAHIRGGGELGLTWYEAGKFLNKKNTFADFVACTEKLISDQYTSHGKIVISGGSAGGLLVGNVVNSHPFLYKAAIAHVPFVDFLSTMLDETLPLTPGEYNEWGNPHQEQYFEYMLSYSPYDNLKEQIYPHMYITSGISDPRVGYWEPAKFVAKLRDIKNRTQDKNLLIFKTNMSAGHGGASGRFNSLNEVANDYIFVLHILNMIPISNETMLLSHPIT